MLGLKTAIILIAFQIVISSKIEINKDNNNVSKLPTHESNNTKLTAADNNAVKKWNFSTKTFENTWNPSALNVNKNDNRLSGKNRRSKMSKKDQSDTDCKKIKCPRVDKPVCAQLVYTNLVKVARTMYVIMLNKCELNYAKCRKGLEAKIVSMKHCGQDLHGKMLPVKRRSKREIQRDTSSSDQNDTEQSLSDTDVNDSGETNSSVDNDSLNVDDPDTTHIFESEMTSEVEREDMNRKKPIIHEKVSEKPKSEKTVHGDPISHKAANKTPMNAVNIHQHHMIGENMHEKPIMDENMHEKPIHDEKVHEKPMLDEKVHKKPMLDETVHGKPTLDETVHGKPMFDEKVHGNPMFDDDIMHKKPMIDENMHENAMLEDNMHEKPMFDETMHDKPMHAAPMFGDSQSDDNDSDNFGKQSQSEESDKNSAAEDSYYDGVRNESEDLSIDTDYNKIPNEKHEDDPELKNVKYEQYTAHCPTVCPTRDVMVCARLPTGVYRTFPSVCHMRMYQCQHKKEELELISRFPCMMSAPYYWAGQPQGRVTEANDHDPVLLFIRCREKGRLGTAGCVFKDKNSEEDKYYNNDSSDSRLVNTSKTGSDDSEST